MLALFSKTAKSTPKDDAQLAQLYVCGDKATYKQVERWISQVTNLSVWHFVEAVEDVNSIVHLKLFSSLKSQRFRGESTFRTYVQRMTRYTCIDQVRSQRVARQVDLQELPKPSGSERPDVAHEAEEERQIFIKIFRTIGPECQKLWRMIFADSLNYREIGERLHLPEGTVKRKVHECKQMAIELKERLI
jgi:RNA polymerase sigma factor (sigma-70 family)